MELTEEFLDKFDAAFEDAFESKIEEIREYLHDQKEYILHHLEEVYEGDWSDVDDGELSMTILENFDI